MEMNKEQAEQQIYDGLNWVLKHVSELNNNYISGVVHSAEYTIYEIRENWEGEQAEARDEKLKSAAEKS